jgi:flagellar hook assembly protein FlgD
MRITLSIYDISGRHVATLIPGNETSKGLHAVRWNGTGAEKAAVGSGVYIVRLSSTLQSLERKLILMR